MPTTRAQAAFDVTWEVYRSIRADLEGIPLIDPTKVPSDHLWRADRGPRAGEYVADFGIACRRSLEGPQLGSRMILCNLYILGLNPWEQTRHFLGIREDVAALWLDEIRERAGRVIMQRGLFPIRQYFGERTRARHAQRSAPSSAAQILRRHPGQAAH